MAARKLRGRDAAHEHEAQDAREAKARLDSPLLLADVPILTGPEREKARKRMNSLLMEEIETWQATRDRDREDLLRTNAPYFHDSGIAESKPESEVLLRREDSSFPPGRAPDRLSHQGEKGRLARGKQKNEGQK